MSMGSHFSRANLALARRLAVVAILMTAGVGCKTTTTSLNPDGQYTKVNIGDYPERELPHHLAWEKLNQSVASARGGGGVATRIFLGKETAAEIQTRLEGMKERARQGQTGSSPVTAFSEMVPEIAQWIAVELPKTKIVQTAATKQILVVAPVANQLAAGTSPAQVAGLDAALSSLGTKLIQNEAVRKNFICLAENSPGGQKAKEAAAGGKDYEFVDPMSGSGGVQKYSPNDIVLIVPRIYQVLNEERGEVQIMMDVRVQHSQTRQDLIANTVVRNYFYQPYQQQWLSEAQNKTLETRFWAAQAPKK